MAREPQQRHVLHEAEKDVKIEKTSTIASIPQIQEMKDSVSGTVNGRLTPGGVVELREYNLKIDGYDLVCGLWFVSETGEELKETVILENKPSCIIVMISTLSAGTHRTA